MSVTTQDLKDFVEVNKPKLKDIKTSLNTFNIFNVLGVQYREIRHSNFLGWIFDPNESHQLGDVFLIDLLGLSAELGLITSDLSKYSKEALQATQVYRECVHNIDVLIVNELLGFVVTIENKIHADYSKHQLAKYFEYVELHYKYLKTRIYLTLTPSESNHHLNFESGEHYSNISYKQVIDILKDNQIYINDAEPSVKESISQYVDMVEKDITKTSKEVALAKEIYKAYKNEIDFIISNQEDFLVYKKEVANYIKNSLEGFMISHDSGDRNVLFVLPNHKELLELFYCPQAESRGGDYIFSLVFHFEKDAVWLKFSFGNIVESEHRPSIQHKKKRLFDEMITFESLSKANYPSIDIHGDNADMDYAGICGVPLFNDDAYYKEGKTFLEMFKTRFDAVNKHIIQPWITECIEKLK